MFHKQQVTSCHEGLLNAGQVVVWDCGKTVSVATTHITSHLYTYWGCKHSPNLETLTMYCQFWWSWLFTFMWPCIVTNLFIIKPTRRTNFPNLFWHETPHVSGSSTAHHQEFIHCTLSNGMCHTPLEQDRDGTCVPSWSCSKAVYKPVWRIPVPSVQWINSWWWAVELPETCRVSCQNKFEKLVYLVGLIIKKVGHGVYP